MPVTNKALPIMNKPVSPKAEVTAKAPITGVRPLKAV